MKTLLATTVAFAALMIVAPIGSAHAAVWWKGDCSLARQDNGKLDSPASEFESWTAAGTPTHIDDKGDEVILTSQYLVLYFWRTREACLADKAKDKAYLDTLR